MGDVENGGNFTLCGVYRLSVGDNSGGLLRVGQGGRAEIVWVEEIKIITEGRNRQAGVINDGGEMILKTER